MDQISASYLVYSQAGGLIFASYCDFISISNSIFKSITGSGGAAFDLRSVAQPIVMHNNSFSDLNVTSFFYISQSQLQFTYN